MAKPPKGKPRGKPFPPGNHGGPGNPNWKPGVSGNPSGREKGFAEAIAKFRGRARDIADEHIDAIVGIIKNEDEPAPARVAAWKTLAEFGYGKAQQSVEVTGREGGPVEVRLTDAERAERVAALLERAGARRAGLVPSD